MEADGFIRPRKTVKSTKRKSETISIVEFQNQFGSLNSEENTDKENKKPRPEIDPENKIDQEKKTPITASKPPVLYIYGVENKYNFSRALMATCEIPPISTHNKERIKLQAQTKEDYDKFVAYCTQQKIEFATELPKKERPIKFVIRKLPADTLSSDIKNDLIELGFPAIEVTQMSGRDKTTREKILYPLFLATFSRNMDVKALHGLQYLLSYKISIETYKPTDIVQCFKCQRFWHSQHTCWAKPRCLKCAQYHLTKNCTKKTRIDPAKCANCGGGHPANYRGCEYYKAEKAKRNPNKEPKDTRRDTQDSTHKNNNPKPSQPTANVNQHDANNTTGGNSRHENATSTDNSSIGCMIKDILQLLQGLNIRKLLENIKKGLINYTAANNTAERISSLGEFIVSILDDGTF